MVLVLVDPGLEFVGRPSISEVLSSLGLFFRLRQRNASKPSIPTMANDPMVLPMITGVFVSCLEEVAEVLEEAVSTEVAAAELAGPASTELEPSTVESPLIADPPLPLVIAFPLVAFPPSPVVASPVIADPSLPPLEALPLVEFPPTPLVASPLVAVPPLPPFIVTFPLVAVPFRLVVALPLTAAPPFPTFILAFPLTAVLPRPPFIVTPPVVLFRPFLTFFSITGPPLSARIVRSLPRSSSKPLLLRFSNTSKVALRDTISFVPMPSLRT